MQIIIKGSCIVVFVIVMGACSTFRQSPGWSLIHIAAMKGDVMEIKKLLESGEDVNKEDKRGRTPLYWASLSGNADTVSYLLSQGADAARGASWKGWEQPVHAAARQGHSDVLNLLIRHGVPVNSTTVSGLTPLHIAAWNQHKEVVHLLIKAGADVNLATRNNMTALHLDTFALSDFRRERYEVIVFTLLNAGADPNVRTNPLGFTPLMYACYVDSPLAVGRLVAAGADINAVSSSGETAASIATKNGNHQIVEFLQRERNGRGLGAAPKNQETE